MTDQLISSSTKLIMVKKVSASLPSLGSSGGGGLTSPWVFTYSVFNVHICFVLYIIFLLIFIRARILMCK